MKKPRRVAIDFDGVIHSYVSGWNGPVPTDPPVPGAFDFLRILVADARTEPIIFSTRSQADGGIEAMKQWFLEHGLELSILGRLEFPLEKPDAKVFLDDRAWNFKGTFPQVEELLEFEPWHRQRDIAGAIKHIQKMQLQDRGSFPTTISKCARCGGTHEAVEVKPFTKTSEFGPTHFVMCPETDEPIMVTLTLPETDTEEPAQEH